MLGYHEMKMYFSGFTFLADVNNLSLFYVILPLNFLQSVSGNILQFDFELAIIMNSQCMTLPAYLENTSQKKTINPLTR